MERKFSEFRESMSYWHCLTGAVVASWSLTQEATGSKPSVNKYF